MEHGVSSMGAAAHVSKGSIARDGVPEEYQLSGIVDGKLLLTDQNDFTTKLNTYARAAARDGIVVGLGHIPKKHRFNAETGEGIVDLNDVMDDFMSDILDFYPEYSKLKNGKRLALYRYLLRSCACYIEKPSVKFLYGGNTPSYEKSISTSNLGIVNHWLEMTEGAKPLSATAAAKLSGVDIYDPVPDNESAVVPHLKLSYDRKLGAHRVINARNQFDLEMSNIRITPIFLLKTLVDEIYRRGREGFVKLNFIKDSGEVRSMVTTFNSDLIRSVYGDDYPADDLVSGAYNGNFAEEANLERGFIRVPSIGESRYDEIMRAVNYGRLVSVEYDAEPDRTFVNIDVNSSINEFLYGVNNLMSSGRSQELVAVGTALREQGVSRTTVSGDPFEMEKWTSDQEMLGGTVFKQNLAIFMMSNPLWFPEYTGEGRSDLYDQSSSNDFGME